MGHIQCKRRARLSNQKTLDTAVVHVELKQTHAAAGLSRPHLHRQFGIPASKQEIAPPLLDTGKEDQHDEPAEELTEDNMDNDLHTYGVKELASKLAQDLIDDKENARLSNPQKERKAYDLLTRDILKAAMIDRFDD